MREVKHLRDGHRKWVGHVVVVEVEDLESLDTRELWGKGLVEAIVGEVEEAKGREGGERRRDGVGELIVGEGEIGEEWEVSYVDGESPGVVESGELKSDDVAMGITCDVEPEIVRG
ncbi:hypothetical protein LR48_Vigan346s000500 [Vigna angularis]|uniref:Uncharacterized protein n=1 Tax=Phaseolus angularis TaxID=3914 RepID=A0A0L9T8L5_PHAAN|nr:hypothetical protein LR48_Vigan346s000500 [Vigna angularis]